jgi:hypothetical protein
MTSDEWRLTIDGIALRGVGVQPLRARFQPVGFMGFQAGFQLVEPTARREGRLHSVFLLVVQL